MVETAPNWVARNRSTRRQKPCTVCFWRKPHGPMSTMRAPAPRNARP